MKKLILYALLLLSSTKVLAQKDAAAKTILDQVSKKYRAFSAIKTDFTFQVENKQAGVNDLQNGTLLAQPKNNKYKLTLYKAGTAQLQQEIISNGKTQWTYLKGEKEVQVNDAGTGDQSFNPAQLFTLYEKGYKYLYTGQQKLSGKAYQVVDLTPEDSKKTFFKVRLLIDKLSKQIYRAVIFDNNGSVYTYTLRGAATNIKAPESTFVFDPKSHPGVEVVDLR